MSTINFNSCGCSTHLAKVIVLTAKSHVMHVSPFGDLSGLGGAIVNGKLTFWPSFPRFAMPTSSMYWE
jgi:hypothetical protein